MRKLARTRIGQNSKTVNRPRIQAGYLAEDYDGIGQYVLINTSLGSVATSYRARLAAGDFGTGLRQEQLFLHPRPIDADDRHRLSNRAGPQQLAPQRRTGGGGPPDGGWRSGGLAVALDQKHAASHAQRLGPGRHGPAQGIPRTDRQRLGHRLAQP